MYFTHHLIVLKDYFLVQFEKLSCWFGICCLQVCSIQRARYRWAAF